VVPCGDLARQWRVTGKAANPAGKSSAEQISQAITGHLQQMPVSVTAQLACTYLTFQELAAIRPCDIVLLDKAVDESVELIVEGRTLFQGRPAKSAGRYAVVITESLSNKPLTPP
jgi:flagellar motor switch protein FliM